MDSRWVLKISATKVDFPPSLGDIPELACFSMTHSKDIETRMHRIPPSKSANKSGELEQVQPKHFAFEMQEPIKTRAICDCRFKLLNRSHLNFLISVTYVLLLFLPRTALMSPEKGETDLL